MFSLPSSLSSSSSVGGVVVPQPINMKQKFVPFHLFSRIINIHRSCSGGKPLPVKEWNRPPSGHTAHPPSLSGRAKFSDAVTWELENLSIQQKDNYIFCFRKSSLQESESLDIRCLYNRGHVMLLPNFLMISTADLHFVQ